MRTLLLLGLVVAFVACTAEAAGPAPRQTGGETPEKVDDVDQQSLHELVAYTIRER